MIIGFILYIGGLIFLSGSALIGFLWSMKDGQLKNFSEASKTIFDQNEPIGVITDQFPRAIRK